MENHKALKAKDVSRELYLAYTKSSMGEIRTAVLRALHCTADSAKEYSYLAALLRHLYYFPGALTLYGKALQLDPNYAEARHGLAELLQKMGHYEQALDEYSKAYKQDPTDFTALWGERLFLPTVYESEEAMKAWRQRWRRNIKEMLNTLSLSTPQEIERAFAAVNFHTNFLLAYQGDDIRDDQQLYGKLSSRITKARFPQFQPLAVRKRKPGDKIRVGFLSKQFYHHSVFKTHGAWITKLDRSRFEIHTFYVGRINDACTKEIESHSDSFIKNCRDAAEWIDKIIRSDLDVLIYPDIGMYPLVQILAALRLAPIQCNALGHPVTAGLKTIDYMLSSALMEPELGQKEYTEKLVLLPNLSSAYSFPQLDMAVRPMRCLKEKDPNKVIYLNVQNLQKLLPRHDDIYPQLALKVPNAEFHFIGTFSVEACRFFFERLRQAFAKSGLDVNKYCIFHTLMPQEQFFGLLQYGDVVLDSLEWSGFNSTMEAIGCDKPVVTLPGMSCRSRHSYAILTMLGSHELIAKTKLEYIDIAASLSDPKVRERAVEKIRQNKMRLFDDPAPIKALEEFHIQVAGPLSS
jgi:predicted O-linked N-acetylglucosamine transferase (SPINDLY family)